MGQNNFTHENSKYIKNYAGVTAYDGVYSWGKFEVSYPRPRGLKRGRKIQIGAIVRNQVFHPFSNLAPLGYCSLCQIKILWRINDLMAGFMRLYLTLNFFFGMSADVILFISKKNWLIGKSLFLRYRGKRSIPGFWGFSTLTPLHRIFHQDINNQQIALSMS